MGRANIQGKRQSGMRYAQPGRASFQNRSEPDRHTDRPKEPSRSMDTALGSVDSDRLEGGQLSLFPPEPSNFVEWRKTLDGRPDLKPCLQRLADGVAFGMDRSAIAGNGVVPMAAARAYRMLKEELQLDKPSAILS